MREISHKADHQYQATNTSCSQTAMAILLSHYGVAMSPEEISSKVPQVKDGAGNNAGTINQQLATWAIGLGYKVELHTFDVQIIDQSWHDTPKQEIINRLKETLEGPEVPSLGKLWSNEYRKSYIDYLEAGGELYIEPCVTSELIYELLAKGPVLTCVCDNTLYGRGRIVRINNMESTQDATKGKATNHTIVIYGNDESGNFLVADPWYKPGLQVIELERMLCAISTAQIECDNLLFQLTK